LILLPQTYGPFAGSNTRAEASHFARYATRAWARDARSFDVLRELLGDDFDPARHQQGVDVAFLLPRGEAIESRQGIRGSEVGINVSGLIWNDPAGARDRYRFISDYREAMRRIVGHMAAHSPVVLVPHVLTPRGHYESDRAACESLVAELPAGARDAVRISPDPADPCEAKGLISSCRWFLGTRMHATIAGLSSGVPTAAISYSDKTLGVFETCGQGEHVHDPRKLSTDELVERVIWSFNSRERARTSLATHLPSVLDIARRQMNDIAEAVRACGGGSASPRDAGVAAA